MDHTHLSWADRDKEATQDIRDCPQCMALLQFSPRYSCSALGEAEYYAVLRSNGMSFWQIADMFLTTALKVKGRITLWSVSEETKQHLEDGKITVAAALRTRV